MEKLQLPEVTCIIVDDVDVERAIRVLERCKELCDFGSVKLLTSLPTTYPHKIEIMPLNSLVAYSIFCLTRLSSYIETKFLLTVQADGWVLNPDKFKHEWLEKYDWISPNFVQYDYCGSGGCSLRSKRLMDAVTESVQEWDGTEEHAQYIQKNGGINYYEDGYICLSNKFKQFNFASLDEAADFGHGGNRNPAYYRKSGFSFHRTWQDINFETREFDHTTVGNTLKNSYDTELKSLTSHIDIDQWLIK